MKIIRFVHIAACGGESLEKPCFGNGFFFFLTGLGTVCLP